MAAQRWLGPMIVGVGLATVGGMAVGQAVVTREPWVVLVALLAMGGWAISAAAPLAGLVVFVLIAVLLPYAVLPVRLVFSPTFVDVTLSMLLASWLVRKLVRREPIVFGRTGVLLTGFLILAVACLCFGTAAAPIASEQLRLFAKLINSLLLFFGVVNIVRDERSVVRVSQALMLSIGAAAAIALAIHGLPRDDMASLLSSLGVLGYPSGIDVLRPVAGTETLRAVGTSVDPNVLGGLIMIGAVLVAGQMLATKPILPKWSLGVLGALMLAAVALTYSRAAWVGLAAGLAFLALFRDKRLLLALPIMVALVLVLPRGRAFVERISSALTLRDEATLMRLAEYRDALALIQEHPWFGVGFGAAPRADLYVGVSSAYLMVAEHMGLLGLGLFLVVLVSALAESFRSPSVSGSMAPLKRGPQAALVAVLVAGLFDHYFFNLRLPHMSAIFWLLVGLAVAVAAVVPDARPPEQDVPVGSPGDNHPGMGSVRI
jgi:O-antigen ligase